MEKVIKTDRLSVKLVRVPNVSPQDLATFAARFCYNPQPPKFGEGKMDVQNKLFKTSHHTTLEHVYFQFEINGISVGDVTFGLHLTSPFYNTDQRSGRFCAEMFAKPDFDQIGEYIKFFWPEAPVDYVMQYLRRNLEIYNSNLAEATGIVAGALKEERPMASDKYIQANAPKIAQEQLRVFIPVIFPTGLCFTIDLVALVSLYRAAWSPVMRYVTARMAEEVLAAFPDLEYMFETRQSSGDLKLDCPEKIIGVLYKPQLELLEFPKTIDIPEPAELQPVDLLHYDPAFMDNGVRNIGTRIKLSVATMGQDQRHRTIRRSKPKFTGEFYIPPAVRLLMSNVSEVVEVVGKWLALRKQVPETLWQIMAPYGAVVEYEKSGSVNAIIHEQGKRTCFCAQEEIYHLGCQLRSEIDKADPTNKLLDVLQPPCFKTGKCAEGDRYCGRCLNTKKEDYFPKRKV